MFRIKFDRKVFIISVGALLEYYNFIIFGLLVPFIFSKYEANSQNSLILGYLIFTVGYIARPIGGFIMGVLSDTKDRMYAFSTIMLLSGGATFLMGVIPRFDSISVFFTALFILRLFQSMGFGGEIPNAITILYEYDNKKKFLRSANVIFNATLGCILAFGTSYLLSERSEKNYSDFVWRVPFLIGGAFSLILYFGRIKLQKSGIQAKNLFLDSKFFKRLKSQSKPIAIGTLLLLPTALLTINNIFLPTYLSEYFNYEKSTIFFISTIGLLLSLFFTISSGAILDKVGFKPVYCAVSVLLIVSILYILFFGRFRHIYDVIFFNITYNIYVSFTIVLVLGLLTGTIEKSVRNSVIGVIYNLSFMMASLLPSLTMKLISIYQSPFIIYYLFIIMVIMSAVLVFLFFGKSNDRR